MKYLVTQSLLSAYSYMFKGGDDAFESFITTLKREPTPQTYAMAQGLSFEDDVYGYAGGDEIVNTQWEEGIKKVAGVIKSAPTQVRLSRDITVNGVDFLLYGILDAIRCGVIYDVKFSSKSLDSVEAAGRYLESPQHPAYMYLAPEAYKFEYLVSDGQELYIESYMRHQVPYIGDYIAEFLSGIRHMDLFGLYAERWQVQ